MWTDSLVRHSQPRTLVDEATLGGGELEGPQEVGDLTTATPWPCFPREDVEKRCIQHPDLLEVWADGVDLVDDVLHSVDAVPCLQLLAAALAHSSCRSCRSFQ